MNKDIKTLRQYAVLRKLPGVIKLGNIKEKLQNDLLKLYKDTPVSNERSSENRQGIYGVEHDDTSPLGKTYNQRHITDFLIGVDCLNEFINKHEWRFADLQPKATIPEHLDDPFAYRFIMMLKGEHEFTSNDKTTIMQEGQVWFVNSAYHHSVLNNTSDVRIALLGKMNVNDHNTGLLRARA